MKRIMSLSIILIAAASRAEAANLAVITNPPTALNALVFLCAVAATGGAVKVLTLVKGGRLSRSWQMFVLGFALLAISQIIMLCQVMEVFTLPEMVVPGIAVVAIGLLFYGILEVKRTLS